VTSGSRLRQWAASIKRDTLAVYLGARDPRVPWGVKLLALAVAAYAISPIDLIPDFIPVLGYLDDLVLVPLGVFLVVRLIPRDVLHDLRKQADIRFASAAPTSRTAAVIVIVVWIVLGLWLIHAVF
jgi:uncharacterized membrane protein YkvA (DUF1232 family)